MLVVAGTAIFVMTFDRGQPEEITIQAREESRDRPGFSRNPRSGSRIPGATGSRTNPSEITPALSLDPSATAHLNTGELVRVQAILEQTERDARRKLGRLTDQYDLSRSQRQQIYPYLLAHHSDAHPSMTVNGQFLPVITPGTTVEDSIASFLDPDQQDELVEASLDDEAWWKEIVGQLESDLNNAIETGEMVPVDEPVDGGEPTTGSESSPAGNPASGEGEASEHSGGNLFDLLGR